MRLWSAATEQYEFDAAEMELLLAACRLVDQLDRLTVALAAAEPMVAGSTGQPRAHPLFDEVRKHSETLAKVVGALAFPKDGKARSSSELGQAAALARWKQTGTKRGA
jgi:hypothetical protein